MTAHLNATQCQSTKGRGLAIQALRAERHMLPGIQLIRYVIHQLMINHQILEGITKTVVHPMKDGLLRVEPSKPHLDVIHLHSEGACLRVVHLKAISVYQQNVTPLLQFKFKGRDKIGKLYLSPRLFNSMSKNSSMEMMVDICILNNNLQRIQVL